MEQNYGRGKRLEVRKNGAGAANVDDNPEKNDKEMGDVEGKDS